MRHEIRGRRSSSGHVSGRDYPLRKPIRVPNASWRSPSCRRQLREFISHFKREIISGGEVMQKPAASAGVTNHWGPIRIAELCSRFKSAHNQTALFRSRKLLIFWFRDFKSERVGRHRDAFRRQLQKRSHLKSDPLHDTAYPSERRQIRPGPHRATCANGTGDVTQTCHQECGAKWQEPADWNWGLTILAGPTENVDLRAQNRP
jgi:hypothetical protein